MSNTCAACHSTKKVEPCGVCQTLVCRKCTQFLEKYSFPLISPRPIELNEKAFCGPCYVSKIGPIESEYNQIAAKAAKVLVWNKAKAEQTRLMDRTEKHLEVSDCEDERDVLMKLAYLAVKDGHNALIYTKVVKKQVRNEGYQTSRWSGSAIPTTVDESKLRPDNG